MVVSAIRPPLLKIFREYRSMSPSSYGSGTTSAASLLCSADRLGTTASGVLVEQCGEFLRHEDPVALDYELTDLLPVRVVPSWAKCVPECLWMRSSASGRSDMGSAAVMVQVPVRRVAIVRLWTTGGASALRSVAGAS